MTDKGLIQFLEQFASENKLRKFAEVLSHRTRYVTVVMDDFYHSHNMSAVLRTCECFGLQDVYAVEQLHKFDLHLNILKGAAKWIDLHRFNRKGTDNTKECLSSLKSQGYRIITADPDAPHTPADLPLDQKMAFVFGTEKQGVSETAVKMSDMAIRIPMYGFTESFNVSVSAALVLREIIERVKASEVNWKLTDKERDELYFLWLKKILRKPALLEKEYFKLISQVK